MRLGYLVPEFPGQTHAFFWREIKALEAVGVEVHLFSTRHPRSGKAPHGFAAEAIHRTTYVFPPGHTALTRLPHVGKGLGYLARLPEGGWRERLRLAALLPSAAMLAARSRRLRLDHLHVHSFADAAHLAALARALGACRYSLTLHGDLPVYGRNHAAKLSGAAFATAVTRTLASDIEALGTRCPVDVVTMGVDTDLFQPVAPSGPARPFTLISVARLNPTKGHEDVLAALAALRADGLVIPWTVIGEGPHRASIEARILALGLGDQVELTGALSEVEVRDRLQEAGALVLASYGLGEAAPVAVMEAMACGVPPLTTRIGATPEMITADTDGMLVPQRDIEALAAGIARLARDPGLVARLGTAARRTACERFDHRIVAAQLQSLIATAVRRG